MASALICGGLACGSSESETTTAPADAGPHSRDAATVDPLEGGGGSDGGVAPPPPSCTKYCGLIQKNCSGEHAQYGSEEACMAFCALLPPGDPFEPKEAPSLACRQYYAGNPALTDPAAYCGAAGPFGGGLCGDRCTGFCQVALKACAPGAVDAAAPPYESLPDCKTACVGFALVDAGEDGGGEGLDGPSTGNTLNCRLYHLRKSVTESEACAELGTDSGACR